MRKLTVLACLVLLGCSKYGVSGCATQAIGDWVQLNLPKGCAAKQIAAEEHSGVVVLCEDGRVFH